MEKIKTNIYLVRHGEKNLDGSSLSRNGIRQSKYLSKRLKKLKFDKVYSSDLKRCTQTAEIVNKPHRMKIITDDALREVKGEVKDFPDKHKKEIKLIKFFWDRVSFEGGNILIVGSGTVNRILISLALKINPKNSRFVQVPTGVTHFEVISKDKTRIEYVNDLSHLPERLKKRQAY